MVWMSVNVETQQEKAVHWSNGPVKPVVGFWSGSLVFIKDVKWDWGLSLYLHFSLLFPARDPSNNTAAQKDITWTPLLSLPLEDSSSGYVIRSFPLLLWILRVNIQ